MSLLDENGLARVWSKMKTWVGNQLPGDFSGATTASAGIHGLVPAPTTTDTEKFLRGDGSWADGSTDEKVTQTESTTDENYEVLVSGTASTATTTEGVNKNKSFRYNPYKNAVMEGNNTIASGQGSHAEGANTIASGIQSHAEGLRTTASGNYAHAEGNGTKANGNFTHAEGADTTASDNYAHAEGYKTAARAAYAHAEGRGVLASGFAAHAEGDGVVASGSGAHAEGRNTAVNGSYAHAEGNTTEANHLAQHVFGEYNLVDASTAAASERGTYVEIVGNGTAPNARSNARTLDWSGNEVLSGKLTVGTAPTADMDVATKKYVDDADNALNSSLNNKSNNLLVEYKTIPLSYASETNPVATGNFNAGKSGYTALGIVGYQVAGVSSSICFVPSMIINSSGTISYTVRATSGGTYSHTLYVYVLYVKN